MKRGLVAWYDGIDNAGVSQHTNAPTAWKDLAGTNDLPVVGELLFEENHGVFAGRGYCYGRAPDLARLIESRTGTIEVVTRIGNYVESTDRHLLSVGFKASNQRGFSLRPNQKDNSVIGCCDYMRADHNLVALPSTAGEVNTHTVIMDGTSLRFAQNGMRSAVTSSRGNLAAGTSDLLSIGSSEIGGKIFKGEVYAVRIYGRVLTDREIELHRAIDLVRFGGRRFADVRPAVLPKGCHLSPDGETVVWGPTGLCVFIY